MAGEIVEGTFIQRTGRRAYELPDQHTIRLRDDMEAFGRCVEPLRLAQALSWPIAHVRFGHLDSRARLT